MNVIVEACRTGSWWNGDIDDVFVRFKMQDGSYLHLRMKTIDYNNFLMTMEECKDFQETDYYPEDEEVSD